MPSELQDIDEFAGCERPRWCRATKLDFAPDMTGGDAFAAIVLHSLEHFAANEECAQRNLHVEGVHQCRIALRRLRAALHIFKAMLDAEALAAIRDSLRWLGGVLGAARDLDVLETELLAPTIAELHSSDQVKQLLVNLTCAKAVAYEAVAEALTSTRCRRLVTDLTRLAKDARPDRAASGEVCNDGPLVELAAQAFSRAYQKLQRKGSGFELLTAEERHDARIALKRLRYALDFFGILFEGRHKKKFIRKVARLQDDLGRMNDIAVAKATLGRLVGEAAGDQVSASTHPPQSLAFVAGSILGWHQRNAADAERRLVKDWYAFVRVTPFWLQHI